MTSASGFEVLAAVDLRAGRVVRLRQGDFDRETTYGSDPVAVASSLVERGARWLHVVDLDGAREGRPVQVDTVRAIVAAVGETARVEVAGGLRKMDAVDEAIAAGAARVVLGTAALRDPRFAQRVVERFGADRVAVALDVRGGRPVVDAWQARAGGPDPGAVMTTLAARGVTTFEVTAVERDGTLEGPDLDLLARSVESGSGRVIGSGGIHGIEDIRALRAIGCTGAIVGRAIYEGRLDLGAAVGLLA